MVSNRAKYHILDFQKTRTSSEYLIQFTSSVQGVPCCLYNSQFSKVLFLTIYRAGSTSPLFVFFRKICRYKRHLIVSRMFLFDWCIIIKYFNIEITKFLKCSFNSFPTRTKIGKSYIQTIIFFIISQ